MLTIRGLTKSYAGARSRQVFSNVALDLAPGEFIAIMGESGVGKSTLLNLIAGLDTPDAGTIRLDEAELTNLDDTARTRLRRDRIGFVYQAIHLLPHLTVAQNVRLPLDLGGIARDEAQRRAEAMLEAVGIAALRSEYPRSISGGEGQRAAIARALVHKPALVLADEPTGNLDRGAAEGVLQLLRSQVKAQQTSAILVTHSNRAAAAADRLYVLSSDGLREQR